MYNSLWASGFPVSHLRSKVGGLLPARRALFLSRPGFIPRATEFRGDAPDATDQALPGYVRLSAVAEQLKVSASTLEKVAKSNQINVAKLGDFSFIKHKER